MHRGLDALGGAAHGFVTLLDGVMLSFASPPNAARRDIIFGNSVQANQQSGGSKRTPPLPTHLVSSVKG
ncbi:hypothetical protein VTP01DRAFT_8755 [Rhizomucor pusillus]|uniref:uncharacterized protein n=1 Tax=Rhizomucor pusillus TaxID=4840 RepID=UPI0037429820